MVAMPPLSVAINTIIQSEKGSIIDHGVNFPTLTAAGYVKLMLSFTNCPYEVETFRSGDAGYCIVMVAVRR